MKIIIATDGSEFSRAAIEKACGIAVKPDETEIKIVSVYQAYIPLDIYPQSAQYAIDYEKAISEQAQKYADEAAHLIEKCLPQAKLNITTEVKMGATDRVIIETAESWNADLIVVGSHGRGFWGRTLIGSVSDAVVHHAPCSVLVARKENAEKNNGAKLSEIDLANIT